METATMPCTLTHRSLDIYTAEACFGCDRARELAAQVRGWRLPHVTVTLRDLGDPGTDRPDRVFAVPTYLLDGRVISLGNPDVSWLYQLLTSEAEDGA
ncbi:MAG TPA: hypothetical protein VGR22_09135 [Thermomicrobiales bacterium]|nr:hypothetical protein [Thermomicrobiales bacterium]